MKSIKKDLDEKIAVWLATHENTYFHVPNIETEEEREERIAELRIEARRINNTRRGSLPVTYDYKIYINNVQNG